MSGDYQRNGLTDFFYPFYLSTGIPYTVSGREDYSVSPTPYGSSVDFILSDARPEALKRYGLVIWSGVPPTAPKLVREKLIGHVRDRQGRVIVYGATARALFPELFGGKEVISAGARVEFYGSVFNEGSDFTLEQMKSTAGITVHATANGKPLVIETNGGIVMILSEYGMNRTQHVDPDSTYWERDKPITNMPHKLLEHARRVMDVEARKLDTFRVSNNSLTYIVTRPRSGEYLLGLLNGKKTSEPFNITSNVGNITSLEEINLNDGKDLLKSAAGGAAYVEAGLRLSPNLPLNYGLSNSTNIEGRDFRLFRIKVQEAGTRQIAQFKFSARPSGTVVAVPSLTGIRRYLQGIPSFFQEFDGIKITGSNLLGTDPMLVAEEAYWLNRRNVRIVIDGQGLSDADAVKAISRLSSLNRAPKDFITNSTATSLTSAARSANVRLVSVGAVNWLRKLADRTKTASTINVMDLLYRDEDTMYQDVMHFKGLSPLSQLRGQTTPSQLLSRLPRFAGLANDFIYVGMDIDDLSGLIEYNASRWTRYRGVKIDSRYVLSKSPEVLASDAATLRKYNLSVVVDLRRDQYLLDGITPYPHHHSYLKGIDMFRNIVAKMPSLGATDLIVGVSDMFREPKFITQRDQAWVIFAKIAATSNVNLHLLNRDQSSTLSQSAELGLANVFVIAGLPGGTPSRFRLIAADGSSRGVGSVRILDADRGLYFNKDLTWNNGNSTSNWNTVDRNWNMINPISSNSIWNNSNADDAVFGAAGVGRVTLTSPITVGDMIFSSPGYTIASATLSLSSSTITTVEDATISSVLAGTTGLNKSGAGKLSLTEASIYSGGTTVTSGTLALGNDYDNTQKNNALGSGSVTVSGGAQLRLGGSGGWPVVDYTTSNAITLDNGTIFANDGIQRLTGGLTVAPGGGTLTVQWADKPIFVEGAVAGSGLLTLNSINGNGSVIFTQGGTINGLTGSGALTKSGTNTLTLIGASSYTGGTRPYGCDGFQKHPISII